MPMSRSPVQGKNQMLPQHNKYVQFRNALDEHRRLLTIALHNPTFEDRTFTRTYTAATAYESPDKLKYGLYAEMIFMLIQEVFDISHCEKYPKTPCKQVCRNCIERIYSVFNLNKMLTTHQYWWYVHHIYYEERHPIFSTFINQVFHVLSTPDENK